MKTRVQAENKMPPLKNLQGRIHIELVTSYCIALVASRMEDVETLRFAQEKYTGADE